MFSTSFSAAMLLKGIHNHRLVLSRCLASSPKVCGELPKEAVKNQHGTEYTLVKSNKKLEHYYREQRICDSEQEFEKCLAAMRADLRHTFRINPTRRDSARQIKTLMNKQMSRNKEYSIRPFNKSGLVWQFEQSRWDIRDFAEDKDTEEERKALHKILINADVSGNMSRQEIVSMVPVWMLDVQPHHRVLDMCSSPGSKTKQVIEALHSGGDTVPSGFVIANEYNPQRFFRLSRQIKRLASPCALTVNHDGRSFPDIFLVDDDGEKRPVRYDRIVCDQPCSGDGTIRKNPNIWLTWTPSTGNKIHQWQYDIARRGLELLKVGGLFAYSSCAMNPIENEAVLRRLLEESGGAFRILDKAKELKERHNVEAAPGLTSWKVFDNRLQAFERHGDIESDLWRERLTPEMFPGGYGSELSNCMRFLPHLTDDGGFFVAILKKTAPMPWEKDPQQRRLELREKKFGLRKWHEISEISGKSFSSLWQNKEKFNFWDGETKKIDEDLKELGLENVIDSSLLYSTSKGKKLTLVNSALKSVLQNNWDSGVNMNHGGVTCFKKETKTLSKSSYCITRKGSELLLSEIPEDKTIAIPAEDMATLLAASTKKAVSFDEGSISQKTVELMAKKTVEKGGCYFKLTLDRPLSDGSRISTLAYVTRRSVELKMDRQQKNFCQLVLQYEKSRG